MLTLNLALTPLIAFARRRAHGGDSCGCWGGAVVAREPCGRDHRDVFAVRPCVPMQHADMLKKVRVFA